MRPTPRKLLDEIADVLRTRRYSPRTIEAYSMWTKRFVRYHGLRHPRDLDAAHVRAYLSYLAQERHVSASTQNQAMAALLFLYRDVMGIPMGPPQGIEPAKRSLHVPTVLAVEQVSAVLDAMRGMPRLMAALLYGSGLRVSECCQLRIKDLDFVRGELTVRGGKGARDRRTMLPASLNDALEAHLARVKRLHDRDVAAGGGRVVLPDALARKLPIAALAVGVPCQAALRRTRHRRDAAPSYRCECRAAGRDRRRARRRPEPACDMSHVSPLVRDAPARIGLRHPHGAGATRPPGREHDDDLHPRAEPRQPRRAQPTRRFPQPSAPS